MDFDLPAQAGSAVFQTPFGSVMPLPRGPGSRRIRPRHHARRRGHGDTHRNAGSPAARIRTGAADPVRRPRARAHERRGQGALAHHLQHLDG